MAIIRKTDPMPARPVIIVLYGTPGAGKTSLAATADEPLLIDTDRGADRAFQRVDTLAASQWGDITAEEGAMRGYKTVIVDTARAVLDDYIAEAVCQQDYKLRKNSLKRFGAMADEFKSFVSRLRAGGSDIIFVCHDKETTEGDTVRHSPDCTGQSRDLLLRIADQVGYLSMVGGRRTVVFDPTDTSVGKNVARLAPVEVPACGTSAFDSCMAGIIARVKAAIRDKGEAQREAVLALEEADKALAAAATPEDAAALLATANTLPQTVRNVFKRRMLDTLAARGIFYDKEAGRFTAAANDGEAGA